MKDKHEKFIDLLMKDVEDFMELDLKSSAKRYLKICLKRAYTRGRIEAFEESLKLQRGTLKFK